MNGLAPGFSRGGGARALRRPGVALLATWGLAVALGAGGCASSKPILVDFSSNARDYRGKDYQDVYERWTRHDNVTHDLISVLEIWATYKSVDFREGFVAHYAETYALSDDDRGRLRTAQRDTATTTYEFLVTAQSSNYRWNDLEKKSSPWRVSLRDGLGHELSPDEVKVERLPDMFEREFYPAKTPFTKTYMIRFSRPTKPTDDFVGDRSGLLMLRFAGPLGTVDLSWTDR